MNQDDTQMLVASVTVGRKRLVSVTQFYLVDINDAVAATNGAEPVSPLEESGSSMEGAVCFFTSKQEHGVCEMKAPETTFRLITPEDEVFFGEAEAVCRTGSATWLMLTNVLTAIVGPAMLIMVGSLFVDNRKSRCAMLGAGHSAVCAFLIFYSWHIDVQVLRILVSQPLFQLTVLSNVVMMTALFIAFVVPFTSMWILLPMCPTSALAFVLSLAHDAVVDLAPWRQVGRMAGLAALVLTAAALIYFSEDTLPQSVTDDLNAEIDVGYGMKFTPKQLFWTGYSTTVMFQFHSIKATVPRLFEKRGVRHYAVLKASMCGRLFRVTTRTNNVPVSSRDRRVDVLDV